MHSTELGRQVANVDNIVGGQPRTNSYTLRYLLLIELKTAIDTAAEKYYNPLPKLGTLRLYQHEKSTKSGNDPHANSKDYINLRPRTHTMSI